MGMAQPANTVVVVEKGEDPAAAASAESCAKIMFILGLFLPMLGLINICMHCGSAYAGARYWAKGSCIQFGLQILLIIIIVVVVVATAGAAITGAMSAAANCKTFACISGAGSSAVSCALKSELNGGTKTSCEAAKCVWTAGITVAGTTMKGTCAPKL